MRPNEYRVWCEYELNGELSTSMESEASWFLMTQTGKLMSHGPIGDFDPNVELKYKKLVVLWYTGHLDDKAQKLFEDDIIEVTDIDGDSVSEPIQVLRFDEKAGAFTVSIDGEDYDITTLGWAMQMEFGIKKIGNIYENPELEP